MSSRSRARVASRLWLLWFVIITAIMSVSPGMPAIAFDEPEPSTPIEFLRKNKIFLSPNGEPLTSIALAPDGRVFVSTIFGTIYGLTLDESYDVVDVQQFNTIYDTPNFNEDGSPAPGVEGRLVLGITFDPESTASQPVMYVSHSDPRTVYNEADPSTYLDVNSGTITRLEGPSFDDPGNRLDVITGLPRSRKNHGTNSVTFGPDGWLYIAQGGNTDLGAAHNTWGSLPEFYLSAAILRADVRSMSSSLDVRHVSTEADLNPLQGEFEIWATGFRNAYDLVWHTDGNLYVNENGANVYQGTTPGPEHGCPNGEAMLPPEQNDALFEVGQDMHAGHPNPARDQCIFRDGTLYDPPKTPDANYEPPLREYIRNLGEVSMNGIAEYPVGAMAGDLINATFSGTQLLVRAIFNADGSITIARMDESGAFDNPLDLDIDDDGTIFIAEFGVNGGAGVSLLIPEGIVSPELSLTSVNPNSGPVEGGTPVTLSGTLFEAGATVTFDGIEATNVVVVDAETITADTPAHSAGAVPVTVTNPGGESATLASAFTYADGSSGESVVRVNSGGSFYTDSNGNGWETDSGFNNGGFVYSTGNAIAGTNDQTLYKSERYGSFSYNFGVENGDYLVTLKFAEIYWNETGKRVFDVAIEGQQVLNDFDIVSEAGSFTAVDKTYQTNVDDGLLSINFDSVVDNAKVSAIEITAADSGEPDTTPPAVTSTDPADGSTDVALDSSVSVTFSEPMNQDSAEAAFAISPDHTGSFSWDSTGTTMTFTPLAAVGLLRPDTVYTVTVDASAADLAGNVLGADASWQFSTTSDSDTTPPTITSTNPADGATDVAVGTTISTTFSEPMNQSSAQAAFELSPAITGSFSWNSTGVTMTFTPDIDLTDDQGYTVTIDASAADQSGNQLGSDATWTFTTASESEPDTTPPTVTADPAGGTYSSAQSVTLSANEPATIYYTTDGSTPDTSSTEYTSAINIDNSTTLKFFGVDTAGNASNVVTEEYVIDISDPAPTLNSLTPSTGPTHGGTDVTLSGSNFVAGAAVTFDGINATNVVVVDSDTITATTPAHSAGSVSVSVINPDGQFDILASAFTYEDESGGESLVRINSGGNFYIDSNGDAWEIDSSFNNGGSIYSTGSAIAGTSDQTLYKSERYGTFSYDFAVDNGDYLVTLKFAEIYWTESGRRVFDVSIEGQQVLDDFDIYAEAGTLTALDKTYPVSVSDGVLTISFTSIVDNAKVSAVEIESTDGGTEPDTTPPTVTSTNPADGASDVALGSPISATFSEAMNQGSVEAAFDLTPDEAGSFSWNGSGTTVTFTPSSNLLESETYSVTIGTGATDLAGNPLQAAATWTFTTESGTEPDTTPPTVTADPAGGTYASAQSVTLSANEPATIYYTTDGSTPDTSSTEYSGAINIDTSTTLKFFGVDTAGNASGVVTEEYVIDISDPAPALNSVTPTSGPTDGGTSVTLSGSNFAAGATVTFDGINATNIVVVESDTITATTPAHSAGSVSVSVINPDGQFDILASAFTYEDESGGESLVRINSGGNFYIDSNGDAWETDSGFSGGGIYSTGNAIAGTTDQTLYKSERHGTLSYDFAVDNGDYLVTLKFAEIYWTESGRRVFDVSIEGQQVLDDFDIVSEVGAFTAVDKTYPVTVSDGQLTISFTSIVDNAKISAVEIESTDGSGEPDTTPPTVTADPDGGTYVGSQSVTLSANEPATIHYTTDGSTPDTSSTEYAAPIDVEVSTTLKFFGVDASGNVSNVVTEEYVIEEGDPAPMLQSIDPTAGPTEGGTSVTLSGENFAVGANVTFGGVNADNIIVVDSQTITASTPAHSAGTVSVTVTNADGQSDTLTNAFTYEGEVPEDGQWIEMPPLPEARGEVGVVEAGGKVYVLGGGSSTGLSNDVFVFDPVAETWDEVAPYPGPAVDHAGAASVNGIVYIIGGLTGWPSSAEGTVYAYDPNTDTWTQKASLPRDRGAMGITVLNGKIYAAGGLVDGGAAVTDFTVYDPATDTWTTLAPMPTARDHLVAEAVGGEIYAIGGRPVDINSPLAVNEAYDPDTDTWETRAPMPTARAGLGSGVLDGRIVVFGGEGNVSAPDGMFSETEEYDPTTDTWRSLAPMITARHGTNGAVLNDTIYVPAGGDVQGGSSTTVHEAFQRASSTSSLVQTSLVLLFFAAIAFLILRSRREPASE